MDGADAEEEAAAIAAHLDRLAGRTAAGLLQEREAGWYEFAHLSFQEYLAARHLAGYVSPRDRLDLALDPAWRHVFLFTAGIAQMSREGLADLLILVRRLLRGASAAGTGTGTGTGADLERSAVGACLAAEMLAELGTAAVRRYGLESALAGSPPSEAEDAEFTGLWPFAVEVAARLAADRRLGRATRMRALCAASRLGDPRFAERDDPFGTLGQLVVVPGGRGRVGTDRPLAMHDPKRVPSNPPRQVRVREFEIGRYPVTNLEYQAFVADGGYERPAWWQSDEAARWRAGDEGFLGELVELWEQQKDLNFVKEFGEPEFATYAQHASARIARRTMARGLPLYWRDARFNLPTAPVVGVNLWEAQAYCAWLQHRLRDQGRIGERDTVAIPTEIEWEWAAGRSWAGPRLDYPWGGRFDPDRCLVRDFTDPGDSRIVNFGAIPVGFFAPTGDGATPPGPEDLGGNVWEWVTSRSLLWSDPGERDAPGGLEKRVVRGGSWYSREPMATHVSFRLDDPPCNAYWDLGFRIVVRRSGTGGTGGTG
ncbi:formylglycine-generating enzyme family protein [Kitasatospora sp. NPDC059327]|uniref:formylglycine-generating enzyme family protein n=1 Tax=Kitasatospora sp. NPDC059327 TaxID=3346803 RepID=UPI0036CE3EEC